MTAPKPKLDAAAIEALVARLSPQQRAEFQRAAARLQLAHAQREHALLVESARDDLMAFAKVTMPDLANRSNPYATRYKDAKHHRALAVALEKLEKGEKGWLNLIVTMPPRHGKSELVSKRFPTWFIGRDPYRQVIFGTYNEDLAGDTGREIREIFRADPYKQVFPQAQLARGSASADRIKTVFGGGVLLAGRGGSVTGRGADLLVVDDPLKGREEAESRAVRKKLWEWYQDDLCTRLLDEMGRKVIVMTRWHEDDLIGRLIDPDNPCYIEKEAAKWRIIHLPALAEEDDPLGRAVGDPLWPEKFGREYLEALREANPRGFVSLYQGKPTLEDGDEFKAEWLQEYRSINELPKNLRTYGASDHAVSTKESADRTCAGIGGVDDEGVLWILPDLAWKRMPPDETVESMISLMRRHQPYNWWAEDEHIAKSIGPFLAKRMREERVNTVVIPSSPAKDMLSRAQSIRGLMALGRVRFPAFASWWQDAKQELLKFPNGTHDDFVSFISHLGRGIDKMAQAAKPTVPDKEPRRGSMAWFRRLASRPQHDARSAFRGW